MREGRIFLDTNVLVYAHDASAAAKHGIARDIIYGLWDSGLGMVSTQVLQEFFVTVTSKLPKPMPAEKARQAVESLLAWELVISDGSSLLRAIDLSKRYRYSFWDSMIIAAAVAGRADVLLSEDLTHGRVVEGVRIINPFA